MHAAAEAGRSDGAVAAHDGREPFRSATRGPMRRDYALKRFLSLTTRFRSR